MLIDGVFGVKKAFNLTDRERNFDEVFRSIVAELGSINATVEEPLMYEVQGIISGFDELIDLFVGEVLAIARMGGRRDCSSRNHRSAVFTDQRQ